MQFYSFLFSPSIMLIFGNKIWKILEAEGNKKTDMKEKVRKEYLRSIRNILKTRHCSQLIKEINIRALSFILDPS